MSRLVPLFVAAVATTFSLQAQPRPGAGLSNGTPKGYVCGTASGLITVDGRLSEPAWKQAPWTDSFTDIEGSLKPSPRYRTRVKMLWDDRFLYIGARIEEPHVWATLTKRDTVIFYDNDFEVFIDPNGDNHEYYELEMNALNTVWDLFLPLPYRDGGKAVDTWDITGLQTAVHVDGTLNDPADRDRGWSAEIALPWKALGAYAHCPTPPGEGDQWRINFSRVEWDVEIHDGKYRKIPGHPEHNWVWSPQWVINMHWPELWGILQFTRGPAARAKFNIPSSMGARTILMSVYYAQVEYRKSHGHWAARLEDTNLNSDQLRSIRFIPQQDGWTAETMSGEQVWRVRHDSKLEMVLP